MTDSAQLAADWGVTAVVTAAWVLCWKYGVIPGRFWIRRAENPRLFLFGIIFLAAVPVFAFTLAIQASFGVDFIH